MKFMPAIFLNHGGGPLPLLGDTNHNALVKYISKCASQFAKPQGILIASAHWEESSVTFVGADNPGLLYDYFGFPPESYKIQYPAKNSQSLIAAARQLLNKAGIPSVVDKKRAYDHGVFVPLKLMFPEADVPVVQISLPSSRNPVFAYNMGKALRSLREQAILLIGSGLSFHNLGAFLDNDPIKSTASTAFDKALQAIMTSSSAEDREKGLKYWESLPHARYCHPNEDHLIPLIFIAGAAMDTEVCRIPYEDVLMGAKISGFMFNGPDLGQEL
jgi:aromatic ring-opening dioxygenase catalytic subunit (LigB family)